MHRIAYRTQLHIALEISQTHYRNYFQIRKIWGKHGSNETAWWSIDMAKFRNKWCFLHKIIQTAADELVSWEKFLSSSFLMLLPSSFVFMLCYVKTKQTPKAAVECVGQKCLFKKLQTYVNIEFIPFWAVLHALLKWSWYIIIIILCVCRQSAH